MVRKEVKKGVRKLSFLLALALVASLVLNLTLIDVRVEAADTIPSKYVEGLQFQTPARDQKQSNLCWAYSTIAALEAAAVKQMGENKDTLDFSEFHLAYFTFAGGHDDLGLTNSDVVTFRSGDYLANGANPQYPMAVLTGGIGPVYETIVPTEQIFESNGYVKSNAKSIRLDETLRRGSNAYDVDVVYDMLINNNSYGTSNRDAVKKAIMECGAVASSYWSAEHGLYYKSSDGEMCCYYQNRVNNFDHGISIVGWDDNFSRNNFHPSKQPPRDGAWLVKNSWGTTTKYTDNEGYFWISYEDASFGIIEDSEKNHAYGYKLRPAGQYKYNYQYDGGIIHEFENFGLTSINNVRYANIFTSQGNQRLDAISVHTGGGIAYAPCVLKVYKDVGNSPEGGQEAYTQNFTLSTNGFHTIKLNTPVEIDEGQKFSIVIYTDEYTWIAADRDYDHVDSNFSVYNHTELNQSFVGTNQGERIVWSDLDYENSHTYDNGQSLCIKALMNDRGSGSGTTVTLDNQSATTPGTANITAIKNQAMPTIELPTKTGYTFDGYYSAVNGGGTKYYNADGSSARNWDSDTITTLYANWVHNHSFTYSASGSDLIATCGNSGCNLTDNKLTLTISASDSTYSGSAHSGATISGDTTNWKSYTGLDIPTINYTGTNYNSTTSPTNAGSYTATITAGTANATCSFSINKATYSGSNTASASLTKHEGNTVTVSLPSIPAGGSYGDVVNSNTGIFTVGIPEGASVQVSAVTGIEGENGDKTFTIPVKSDNYSDYNITVTISLTDKQTQTITAGDITATYGDVGTRVVATGASTTLSYSVTSGVDVISVDSSSGNIAIHKAGNAVITITAEDTSVYAGASKEINVTINKSTPQTPTTPSGLAPTTDGGTDGKVTGVDKSMEYSTDSGNTWSNVSGNEITGLASGTTVKLRIKETENTNASASVDLTIPNYQGSGGGNGGGPGGYYTPTVTPSTNSTSIPISSDTSANVNVRVQNNTAVIDAINENTINSIIKDNDASSSEAKAVTIDLSKANANITAVTITKATAEAVAKVLSEDKNIKENLEIKLPNTTIILDDKAITAIAEQAKTDEIKIVVENTAATKLNDNQKAAVDEINKQENKSVAQTFEAYMVSGTERISDFKGGTVRVSKIDFKLPADKNPKFYHIYYLPDKGEPVRHETWYEDGALHFETKHFSDYAIIYDETMENGQTRPVFRLWNPKNGDHLLTGNDTERDACEKAGWKYEGIAFVVGNDGKKVYRLYNQRTGEHFYTASEVEKEACVSRGWKLEGVAFTTDGTKDIYRLYSGRMHLFTANADERDHLEKLGWTYEGIGFKAM